MTRKKQGGVHQVPEPPVDFVIVTALPEERDAILTKLRGARKLDKGAKDLHTFYTAQVNTRRRDRSKYNVIITCLVKMGPITATAQTVSVVTRWQPRFVMLVGIACGIKGSVNHGDVIVASQVADYTVGKQEGGARKINWDVHPCGVSLLDSVHDLGGSWRKSIAVERPGGSDATHHIGVVASGGDVIQDDEILATYSKAWPKLIGIEMESGGVAAGVHQTPERPEFLMVKGVSDFGRDKHDPEIAPWRAYACDAAAAFALTLIRSGPAPSQALAHRTGTSSEAEEKRRQGERQWEYLLSHPFRTLEFFLLLKGDVGGPWFDNMLADASVSFDRHRPSVRQHCLSDLVAASRESHGHGKPDGERGPEYWSIYEGEEGFWVTRRGPGAPEKPDRVAGINFSVDWQAVAPPGVQLLRDLSHVSEFNFSLPAQAFDVGVEEFEFIFHGEGFSFDAMASGSGVLDAIQGFAVADHELGLPKDKRMMLGTGFAGGQLLEMFFEQYMRHWTEDPAGRSKFKGRIGRSGSSGQGITFYPGEPKSFRGSAEEKDYVFTISAPDTETLKQRIAELERSTHAQSANEETYAELAYRYAQQGRWVEAIKVVQRASALSFSGPALQGVWGGVLGEMGRHEEAIEHLQQAVTLEPESGFRRTALGVGLFNLGRKADAVGEFRRALSLEPANLEFQRNLAVALSETNEDTEQAISLFQAVLAANPDNALALFKLGRLLEKVGQKEDANRCFETATTVPSADVDAFVELGLYRAREGDQSAAVAAFEKALERKKSPDIYSLLGGSFVGLDRMEEAEKAFREGHRLGPNHQRCLAQLGAILGRRGALDEAMPLLERAVALDPTDEQSQHNLRLLKSASNVTD